MNKEELLFALNTVESEKGIDKESLIDAIKNSILNACKQYYGTAENITVTIDSETGENHVYASKKVVDVKDLQDEALELTEEEAKEINSDLKIGDVVQIEVDMNNFGRIVTSSAKNMIIQKIREDERNTIYNEFYEKEHQVVTGIVQRYSGDNISINLGKADAILTKNEQIEGEHYKPTDRIKVYILEVRNSQKGLRMRVSRTHPELVKKLFEEEVTEVRDGIVEIKAIAREAGNRSKIAVWSNDPDVDPVGACVGMNGSRVNSIVAELHNEKIDIINWDENPAYLIQNALSPAMVISVIADEDEKSAKVVVPDDQLSLAIGMKGQNARLAARLTGFKIDIKSESQARESGDFIEYEEEYDDEYYEDEYYDDDEQE